MKTALSIIISTVVLLSLINSSCAFAQTIRWENKCKGGGQSFHVFYWDFFATSSEHITSVGQSGSYESHQQSRLAIITAVMYHIAGSGASLAKKTIWNVPYLDVNVVMDERSGQCDIYQK